MQENNGSIPHSPNAKMARPVFAWTRHRLRCVPLLLAISCHSIDIQGEVVRGVTRRFLGPQSFSLNVTNFKVVDISAKPSNRICSRGESGLVEGVEGAVIILRDQYFSDCASEHTYLVLRGAGAVAIIAGVEESPPGFSYYVHQELNMVTQGVPVPWLDVSSSDLPAVVSALRAGHSVILAPTRNLWHVMFTSAAWIAVFRVVLPGLALAAALFALRNLYVRGALWHTLASFEEPNALSSIVLIIEAATMTSITIASFYGLYWSGGTVGRWLSDLHATMFSGSGFFTSVLLAMHLSRMRKVVHTTVEPSGGAVPPPVSNARVALLFSMTTVAELVIILLVSRWVLPFTAVFVSASVFATLQCAVAVYFIKGARVACSDFSLSLHRWRLRTRPRAGRSTLTPVERHLYATIAWLALSAIGMLASTIGFALVGSRWFFRGPSAFFLTVTLLAAGRIGTALAQVRALAPPPSLVRFSTAESAPAPPRPSSYEVRTEAFGDGCELVPSASRYAAGVTRAASDAGTTPRTPRRTPRTPRSTPPQQTPRSLSTPRTPRTPTAADASTSMTPNMLTQGNLEAHNLWLNAKVPVVQGQRVVDRPGQLPPITNEPHDAETDPASTGAEALSMMRVRIETTAFDEIPVAVTSSSTVGELRTSVERCARTLEGRQYMQLRDHNGQVLHDTDIIRDVDTSLLATWMQGAPQM